MEDPEITDTPMPWPRIITKATHDMRTPLSSMRVALEILRVKGNDLETRQKIIEILKKNVDELAELLSALSADPRFFADE